MDVRLAPRYRTRMLLLLPLTAGLGTLWLWLRASRWPRTIGREGVGLRNGRLIAWREIRRVNVVKHQFFEDEQGVIRLDLETYDGVIALEMCNFENAQEVARAVRDGFKDSRRAPAAVAAQAVG